MKVDKEKDQVILKLHDAWNQLVGHWKELEEHRHILAMTLDRERETFQKDMSEAALKINRYEGELSKALDLAQGYKEKSEVVEKEIRNMEVQHTEEIKKQKQIVSEVEQKLTAKCQDIVLAVKEKEELIGKLKVSQQDIQKERSITANIRQEVTKLGTKVKNLESELTPLKEEKATIQLKYKEEKARIHTLEHQKKLLQISLDDSNKKQKLLAEEISQNNEKSEKAKGDLRDFYQGQVEVVIHDKLQEFQAQLDAAETSLHKELQSKQHCIVQAAAQQIKDITDKHNLEIKLLEEKHIEELQLNRLHLSQASQQIALLHMELQRHTTEKSKIVEKLHGVMETQWQEALRILSGNSPMVSHAPDSPSLQSHIDNIGVMNRNPVMYHEPNQSGDYTKSLNKQSLVENQAMRETQFSQDSQAKSSTSRKEVLAKDDCSDKYEVVPLLEIQQQSTSSSTADDFPFSRQETLTYRVTGNKLESAPLHKKGEDLKKYIQMLLNKTPGKLVEKKGVFDESMSELPQWERVGAMDPSIKNGNPNTIKDSISGKPPWK